MKLKKADTKGKLSGNQELPRQFSEEVRPDIIKRAVHAFQSTQRQKYGTKPEAGLRHSSDLSKRRRKYRGVYGQGRSRTPRKVMSRSGLRFNYKGAEAPNTVGGRRSHPPKASKEWAKKINKKEKRKAIRSALAATIQPEIVTARGHRLPKNYPFILHNDFEKIDKTQDLLKLLQELGFEEELQRTKEKKVRPGKGKNRGRPYKKKTGILFVVSKHEVLTEAARNIPGVDIVTPQELNPHLLAPGAHPGRLTLFTENAMKILKEKEMYM